MKRFVTFFTAIVLTLSSLHEAQANMKISYQEVGSGTPIVLLHPFPTDKDLWQPQREGLQKHFRVITLDLLGFGEAAPVDGKAISMSEYAAQVKELMDQLHLQKAIIGGESMGGYVALAFLKNYPERVSGLILADTQAIADSEEARAKRESSALDILKNGTSGFNTAFLPKALSQQAHEHTKIYLKSIMDKQSSTAMASALRGMGQREDLSSVLAKTSLPVLIISGSDDVVISPKQSDAMHALASNSKLVMIEGAGHLASLERPDSWNKAVVDYFQ